MKTESPSKTSTRTSDGEIFCVLEVGREAITTGRAQSYVPVRRICKRTKFQENVGSFTRSSSGTDSVGSPALRQAVNPPTITNVLNPFSRSRCATRALVASRAQVQ